MAAETPLLSWPSAHACTVGSAFSREISTAEGDIVSVPCWLDDADHRHCQSIKCLRRSTSGHDIPSRGHQHTAWLSEPCEHPQRLRDRSNPLLRSCALMSSPGAQRPVYQLWGGHGCCERRLPACCLFCGQHSSAMPTEAWRHLTGQNKLLTSLWYRQHVGSINPGFVPCLHWSLLLYLVTWVTGMRELYLEGTPQGGTCCRVLRTHEGRDSPQNHWRAAVLAQLCNRDTAKTKSALPVHCSAAVLRWSSSSSATS